MAVSMRRLAGAIALLPYAAQAQQTPTPGQAAEIVREVVSSETGSDGSSGSSTDRDALVERVVAARDGGLELQYEPPAGEREAEAWQFPVRVFKRADTSYQLLNREELEARIDPWLRSGGLTRAACGQWIFTWNAFKIECDPQSAIRIVEAYDLRPADLREGALYRDADAREAARLVRKPARAGGTSLSVELAVDPERVRKSLAETDVVVSKFLPGPVTLETALATHADERISGTITVRFDLDAAGTVQQRIRTVRLEIQDARRVLKRTVTETTIRRPLPVTGV